jgi:hypothetical protein
VEKIREFLSEAGYDVLLIMLLACAMLLLATLEGCSAWEREWKHEAANWFGASRTIQFISCTDGFVVREWTGNFRVDVKGSTVTWIDDRHKEHKISGCFVIDEN